MKSKDGLRVHGFKRMYNDIYFTRIKKHYCPECGERLGLIACSKVVNRKSEEARNFNFSIGDSYMIGNIKFTWDEFIVNNMGSKPSPLGDTFRSTCWMKQELLENTTQEVEKWKTIEKAHIAHTI